MAAAVALESAGAAVTLIEARKTLGGRAGSFEDPTTGEILDNCQHVLLGCCTNLIDFYRRINVLDRIRWESTIRFVDPHGREHGLWGIAEWPLRCIWRWRGRSSGADSQGAIGAGPGDAGDAASRPRRPGRSSAMSPSANGSPSTINREVSSINSMNWFWSVLSMSDAAMLRAAYAIQVFQEGMLAHSSAYRMGTPACPLGKLYETLPCRDVRLVDAHDRHSIRRQPRRRRRVSATNISMPTRLFWR